MSQSALDVDIYSLSTTLPLLLQAVDIVGSEGSVHAGTLRLLIEGRAVPEVPLVRAIVHQSFTDNMEMVFRITFEEITSP